MQFFDLSTTVDPGYIISLIRKLLPSGSASVHGVTSDCPNKEEGDAPSASISNGEHIESSNNKTENMDVDVSRESSHLRGDDFEHSGDSVGEDKWEEYGCILWDLAASKTHAELMVLCFCFLVFI